MVERNLSIELPSIAAPWRRSPRRGDRISDLALVGGRVGVLVWLSLINPETRD
jgi:hypothetical protein